MRRRLLIAAVFLLAGAVVNVAVAWGCAVWIDLPGQWLKSDSGGSVEGPNHDGWFVLTYGKRGVLRVCSRWSDPGITHGVTGNMPADPAAALVPKWAPFLSPSHEPPIDSYHAYFVDARGWPLQSMWSGLKYLEPSGAVPDIAILGIVLDPELVAVVYDHQSLRILPLRPLAKGFVINTLFYAALLWLLACGLPAIRRLIRGKRGLCPACAYPHGESPVCSECGKALPGRAKVAT